MVVGRARAWGTIPPLRDPVNPGGVVPTAYPILADLRRPASGPIGGVTVTVRNRPTRRGTTKALLALVRPGALAVGAATSSLLTGIRRGGDPHNRHRRRLRQRRGRPAPPLEKWKQGYASAGSLASPIVCRQSIRGRAEKHGGPLLQDLQQLPLCLLGAELDVPLPDVVDQALDRLVEPLP